jgi:drug/metabolite transporter (DMT)-like permease
VLNSGELLPSVTSAGWSMAAGLSGVGGLGAFYLALSRGTMGLIAPLAALIGAALPALVAVVAGEQLGTERLAGIVLALVAVVLISLPGGEGTASERRALRIDLGDLPLVLLAGLGFAGFYLFLDRAAAEGGGTWWSIFAVRLVGFVLVVGVIVGLLWRARADPLGHRLRRLFRLSRARALSMGALSVAPLFVLAGLGDLGGNVFFLLANEQDALSVAVVLSSLYPVVTTVLAAVFLRERLRPPQLLGIALAVAAVVLIGR